MAILTYAGVGGAGLLALAAALPDPGRSDEWQSPVATLSPASAEPLGITPASEGAARPDEARDRTLIESHPVCVASRVWSAGTKSDTVYYRYHRDGDRLTVGYFVHWSTERPWGNNWLTYALAPALAVDGAYSHGLFVLPGARDFMYGPGDVEGAAVTYQVSPDGRLTPLSAQTEDGLHNAVQLERDDIDARGRTALVTDVWSHQLGGRGAARAFDTPHELHEPHCFSGAKLQPLNDAVTRTFELGNAEKPLRAKSAWKLVEPQAI
jgi:hypothetical protein